MISLGAEPRGGRAKPRRAEADDDGEPELKLDLSTLQRAPAREPPPAFPETTDDDEPEDPRLREQPLFQIKATPRGCNPNPVPTEWSPWGVRRRTAVAIDPTLEADGTEVADLDLDDEEFAAAFQDILSEDALRQLAGTDDLESATFIELQIDTTEQSIETLGRFMPSLQQLKLSQSVLSSFRDLGTALQSLRILWVSRCGITDLDGIGALVGLQELYISFNDVSDLTPLAMHDCLQVLDLDSNRVADVDQLDQLGSVLTLVALTLESNPITRLPNYRRLAFHHIPHLETLDDEEPSRADREPVDEQELLSTPRSGYFGLEGDLIADAVKQDADLQRRGGRPGSGSADQAGADDSELTHGSDVVFGGNAALALRRRRAERDGGAPASPSAAQNIVDTLDRTARLDEGSDRDQVLAELKAWKLEAAVAVLHANPDERARRQRQRPMTAAAPRASRGSPTREVPMTPRDSSGGAGGHGLTGDLDVDMEMLRQRASGGSGARPQTARRAAPAPAPAPAVRRGSGGAAGAPRPRNERAPLALSASTIFQRPGTAIGSRARAPETREAAAAVLAAMAGCGSPGGQRVVMGTEPAMVSPTGSAGGSSSASDDVAPLSDVALAIASGAAAMAELSSSSSSDDDDSDAEEASRVGVAPAAAVSPTRPSGPPRAVAAGPSSRSPKARAAAARVAVPRTPQPLGPVSPSAGSSPAVGSSPSAGSSPAVGSSPSPVARAGGPPLRSPPASLGSSPREAVPPGSRRRSSVEGAATEERRRRRSSVEGEGAATEERRRRRSSVEGAAPEERRRRRSSVEGKERRRSGEAPAEEERRRRRSGEAPAEEEHRRPSEEERRRRSEDRRRRRAEEARPSNPEPEAQPQTQPQPQSSPTRRAVLDGNSRSNDELVELIRMGKMAPELSTANRFRRFFATTDPARLRRVLEQAYADVEPASAAKKIEKRMALMRQA